MSLTSLPTFSPLDRSDLCPYSSLMNATNWTLMNTSITHTTSYGYSNTCTLADAMRNRARNQLTNLAECFGSLGMAIGMSMRGAKP